MFANVVEVMVDVSMDPQGKRLKEGAIPRYRNLPGVVAGFWLKSVEGKGMSIVVFETEVAALGAIETMGLNAGASPAPGVTVERVQTREVIGSI